MFTGGQVAHRFDGLTCTLQVFDDLFGRGGRSRPTQRSGGYRLDIVVVVAREMDQAFDDRLGRSGRS